MALAQHAPLAPIFAAATLGPVPLLVLAGWWGGAAPWLALLAMTLFVGLMDRLLRVHPAPVDWGEFPAGTGLSLTLAAAQVGVTISVVAALSHAALSPAQAIALFLAAGLWIGQIGNANAHELIHRADRRLFRIGTGLFVLVLFGHHASAHRLVHHRHVGTDGDPNSARLGEGFYAFARRVWVGALIAGWRAERHLRRKGGNAGLWRHPYLGYLVGALLCLCIAFWLGGPAGLLWYVALCAHAQIQLLLSDYVQHYGLRRGEIAPGRLEPVGPIHSWNAPHPYSGAMLLNAPRHSDHHAHPSKPWPSLTLDATCLPTLPHSLPVMATIALSPRHWFRLMDSRARTWSGTAGSVPCGGEGGRVRGLWRSAARGRW